MSVGPAQCSSPQHSCTGIYATTAHWLVCNNQMFELCYTIQIQRPSIAVGPTAGCITLHSAAVQYLYHGFGIQTAPIYYSIQVTYTPAGCLIPYTELRY